MLDDLLDEVLESEEQSVGAVIGIDLGTTNTVASVVIDGIAEVICSAEGHNLQPSVVAWTPRKELLVGMAARLRRVIDPMNTIYSAKRIIGQPFGSARVQQALTHVPYRVTEGDSQQPMIHTRAGVLTVPEVSGHLLAHLRTLAEARLGQPVTHCVVTVPANFSDGQRSATRLAAQHAGMEVLRILNEPTAAALAYGQHRELHQRIAVFDMGGGTFDVTLLAVREHLYEVIATGGDPFLGGDDMDQLVADRLSRQFLEEHRVDANEDPTARARLLIGAEQIKMKLSQELVVEGALNELAHGVGGKPLGLNFRIERAEFEGIVAPIVEQALATTERVLSEAGVSADRIDEVILVGGSTRVPLVRRRVAEHFGRRPRVDMNPMEVVATGAALQAYSLFHSADDRVEVGVLMDVTSHSLALATAGGYAEVLIAKNTTIPAEGTKMFSTARDSQTRVELKICQGESKAFEENVPVGYLVLDNLPPAPRGEVKLQVEFLIDADGMLQVSARDCASGVQTSATLSMVGVTESR